MGELRWRSLIFVLYRRNTSSRVSGQMTDEQISAMVTADLSSMLGYKATIHPDLVRVFRHSCHTSI